MSDILLLASQLQGFDYLSRFGIGCGDDSTDQELARPSSREAIGVQPFGLRRSVPSSKPDYLVHDDRAAGGFALRVPVVDQQRDTQVVLQHLLPPGRLLEGLRAGCGGDLAGFDPWKYERLPHLWPSFEQHNSRTDNDSDEHSEHKHHYFSMVGLTPTMVSRAGRVDNDSACKGMWVAA